MNEVPIVNLFYVSLPDHEFWRDLKALPEIFD